MLPSEGLKLLLVAAGFPDGGATDWATYLGRRPDKPNRIVTLYDSGGGTPNPKWLIDEPSVQIKVRGKSGDYYPAFEKAQEIKRILLGAPSQDIGGDRWVNFNMAGDIGYLGLDNKDQPDFVLNFNLIIEPAAQVGDHRAPL